MALTLDLPPATEQALKEKAVGHGMAPEAYALDVLSRDVLPAAQPAGVSDLRQRYDAFLAAIEAAPETGQDLDIDAVTRVIRECREARDRELLTAAAVGL